MAHAQGCHLLPPPCWHRAGLRTRGPAPRAGLEAGTAEPSEPRERERPSLQSPGSGYGYGRALRAMGTGTAEPSEPRERERPSPQSPGSGYGYGRALGAPGAGGIQRLLKDALQKFLPPNAHELLSGKLHIVLTRLHDWRNVTVSDFASKEELIQAVMCSCYVPVYFGFSPPTYRGVRYVDGELAMWRANFVSRSTITISAFAGEYDICPRDGPAAFLTFQLADCIMQISKMNFCRLKNILLVPKRQVMDRFLIEGYQDTVYFLKRLRDFQVNYFEGFTLSLANESIQKGEETLLLKPQMRVLHSRATDHEDDTTENSGISQQKMK
ncbi:PREDICTED: patatin-like phospholipase domain-containing protein 1 [Pseudopodoces humilis]|uniref:patatin-like phospholipase domain-containing protein 1 n=1 Tax=Pseudopodoces humilis TaxID=181119 RepID=UPI0006B6A3B2|nr:PREDICTED: patatin-like phospholipase domain-containing protein 1 [Pseudopodoces humilis]